MPLQTENGIIVPTNPDAFQPTTNFKTMADSTTVITDVSSVVQRDALTKWVGRRICRVDLNTLPVFVWDGTSWPQVSGIQHAEYTGPAFTTTAGAGTNFGGPAKGVLTADATRTQNNAFVQPYSEGRIQILQDGVYALQGVILPTAVPTSYSMRVVNVSTGDILASTGGVGYGDKEQAIAVPNAYLSTGAILSFTIVTSASLTMGTRVRATKVQ